MVALRSAVAVAALLSVTTGEPVFDPPFEFSGLPKAASGKVPSESDFGHACFRFIYDLGFTGGKGAVEKKSSKKVEAANIPEAMMPSCLQKDREGCHRFAEQLQAIVERKESEPAMTRRTQKKHGKALTKAERKALNVQAKSGKKASASSDKPQPAQEQAAKSKPDDSKDQKKKEITEYGMKAWKPHHKKSSFLSTGFNANDYGLTPAVRHGDAISLIQTQKGPRSYGQWCTRLYAASVASYDPHAATTTTTAAAALKK